MDTAPLSPSVDRVQRSVDAGMPRAAFVNGRRIADMPAALQSIDVSVSENYDAFAEAVAVIVYRTGYKFSDIEVLICCYLHPDWSAVDCLPCEPIIVTPEGI